MQFTAKVKMWLVIILSAPHSLVLLLWSHSWHQLSHNNPELHVSRENNSQGLREWESLAFFAHIFWIISGGLWNRWHYKASRTKTWWDYGKAGQCEKNNVMMFRIALASCKAKHDHFATTIAADSSCDMVTVRCHPQRDGVHVSKWFSFCNSYIQQG